MTIYVRAIEGTVFYLPVPAKRLGDNRYLILEWEEFDPNDTYTIPEFIPGDTVVVVQKVLQGDPQPLPVAETLVSSVAKDRAYWDLLFRVVNDGPRLQLEMTEPRRQAAERIARELDDPDRYHYPAIRSWMSSQGRMVEAERNDENDT